MYTFCDRAFNLLSSFCMSLEITIKKRVTYIYASELYLSSKLWAANTATPIALRRFQRKKKIRRETSSLQWRGASKEATNIKR